MNRDSCMDLINHQALPASCFFPSFCIPLSIHMFVTHLSLHVTCEVRQLYEIMTDPWCTFMCVCGFHWNTATVVKRSGVLRGEEIGEIFNNSWSPSQSSTKKMEVIWELVDDLVSQNCLKVVDIPWFHPLIDNLKCSLHSEIVAMWLSTWNTS
jgi:hypothetical protein